jgi:hypothetical protein
MNAREALLSVKEVVERFGDSRALHSYHLEFSRRLEVLKLVERYLRISEFKDLVRIALKKPIKLNTLRLLAYPIVKLRPSLRQLIVVVATKTREPTVQVLERW